MRGFSQAVIRMGIYGISGSLQRFALNMLRQFLHIFHELPVRIKRFIVGINRNALDVEI
ncbi:hypothetical protein D3C77_804130 [compost metagenome]